MDDKQMNNQDIGSLNDDELEKVSGGTSEGVRKKLKCDAVVYVLKSGRVIKTDKAVNAGFFVTLIGKPKEMTDVSGVSFRKVYVQEIISPKEGWIEVSCIE